MQRRLFLKNIAWLSGGLVASSWMPSGFARGRKKIKGVVRSRGRGIRQVVVSDGYSVVLTNHQGKYELDAHPKAKSVFVSTPSGYEFNHQDGIARHYQLLKNSSKKEEVNFELVPLDKNDDEHQFVIWADPQVKNKKDVEKMMQQSVPDVQAWVSAAGPGALVHGITVGDIVWDELELFADYNQAVKKMGIPFFQCLGNHDMDYKGDDETSDDTFQETYGPTYYSFNRGQVHYVVMDDVRYLGKDREYDGYVQQHQLDWLQKDLAHVASDKLIVLCVHIPVHLAVKNKDALYAVLGNRNVHIMSGHTHYHVNDIRGNIYEHNHGTVCGAWWTGPICGDGTPGGYGVYTVKGKELSWQYKSTGQETSYQMKIFQEDHNAAQKKLLVNIWNYDPAWKTELWQDGMLKGPLEQFEGYDPLAYATMLGPDKPKPRGFAEPKMTDHLFRAFVPASAREIKIVATDRFGRKYTSVHNLIA
jgi:hypothetical protein